jgi:hypothetical protein
MDKHHAVYGEDACLLMGKDNSAVLLRQRLQGVEGWQAWPLPLRLPLGADGGWVVRNWRDLGMVEAFNTLPPCARGWEDVAAGAALLPWWPLSNGWPHAPHKPDWAQDPRAALLHLAQVACYVAHKVGYASFAWRAQINPAQVLADGVLEAPEAGCTLRGTAPNTTLDKAFEHALFAALHALVGEMRQAVGDAWFVHSWLSRDTHGRDRVTSGPIASVGVDHTTHVPNGHTFLSLCAALPPAVTAPLLALQP